MRKVVKVVLVLAVIILNIAVALPDFTNKAGEPKDKETCVLQPPTLQLNDMTSVIIPSLFKVLCKK